MGLVSSLVALKQACDRYIAWYDALPFLPKCPFCRDKKRAYHMNRPTLVDSRFNGMRVRMVVICANCGMRMTASRFAYSRKWSFTQGSW